MATRRWARAAWPRFRWNNSSPGSPISFSPSMPASTIRSGTTRLWQQVRAVQQKHVYHAPSLPFGWVDEPPAANRLIGLRWLGGLLYPSLFREDIRAETRRFYALFYQQEPSNEQLDQLLAGTTPPH